MLPDIIIKAMNCGVVSFYENAREYAQLKRALEKYGLAIDDGVIVSAIIRS
tara:strand:+ start:193 stop:345 length:153 start_codon:yes stop_codon:yes gene_type:complete